jgi:hypothetical protein
MSRLTALLYAAVVVLGLCLVLLGAQSCATTRVPAAADTRVDSALTAAGIPPLGYRRVKIKGNVILNTGAGSVTTSDNRKAGQRQGSAATAPDAHATTTSKNGGPPWYVYAGLAALGFTGGFYARGKLRLPFLF